MRRFFLIFLVLITISLAGAQPSVLKTKELSEQLIQAAVDSKTAQAIDLIKQGAEVDFIDKRTEEEVTPLIAATSNGNLELMKALLNAGADLEKSDKKKRTPLVYAMMYEQIEAAKLLIAAKANIDASLEDGTSVLAGAVMFKHRNFVRLLIDSGADVNNSNSYGITPLMSAVSTDEAEIVKLFLAKKADVKKETKEGATALHYAVSHSELIPLLLQAGAEINKPDRDGVTSLMAAAQDGYQDSAVLLIKNGADLNLKDRNGNTALDYAKEFKQKDVLEILQNPISTLKEFRNSLGIEFVLIPRGSFMMGSPETESNRRKSETQHQVTISKEFYLSKFETTQEQWEKLMGNNPSDFKDCPKCPVENVSWEDVQDFITKLNKQGEGNYRLPTEAEWEYAARAGTTTVYAFGDSLAASQANFKGSLADEKNIMGKTTVVGSYKPNKWGLYDMHGNVGEWVNDWYEAYSSSAQTDPSGPPTGEGYVVRGGGWGNGNIRSAARTAYLPSKRSYLIGFRLVREF